MPGSGQCDLYTLIKMINCFSQLTPFALQYVSIYLLYDLTLGYLCERTGVTVEFNGQNGKSDHIQEGVFHCDGILEEPVFFAIFFFVLLIGLVGYSWGMVLRQTRHSRYGTLDYLCYLEVAKTQGSWAFMGFKGQAILTGVCSLAAVILGVCVLAIREARGLDYASFLTQWVLRTCPGFWAVVSTLWYKTPVNGKPHARFARYVTPDVHLYYAWWRSSKNLIRELQDIVSLDPVTAEAILIEASYPPDEKTTRQQYIKEILHKGIPHSKIQSANWWPTDTLGGNLKHINPSLMSSIGLAGENADPSWKGDDGNDIREQYEYADTYNDGEYPPPYDTLPRARSAQVRYRELLYYFGDSQVREGLISGECEYAGIPKEDTGVRKPPVEKLADILDSQKQTYRSVLLSWRI
eukprot:Hpha_TRINITY_DN11331_c0_g1::TRINITY_DN11331_c0_g1_i1::g.63107::m.63107